MSFYTWHLKKRYGQQNIEKTYNDSWNNLTTEQKNEGIQEQLKTGNYTVYNVDNASNVDPSRFDIISVAVNPYSVIGIPTDETSTEFINRVSVHEGKGHGIYGLFNDFLASAMRKNPKDQEQFSYEQEQTAVNQNNAKRR